MIAIRKARPAERALLEELQRRASFVHAAHREQLEAHPEAMHLPQSHMAGTIVAEVEGVVAGFAVTLGDGEMVELDGLFVEPDMNGRRIGTALIERAIADARMSGAARMVVVSGFETVAFYARCGFKPVEQVETQFAPAMRLEIAIKGDG